MEIKKEIVSAHIARKIAIKARAEKTGHLYNTVVEGLAFAQSSGDNCAYINRSYIGLNDVEHHFDNKSVKYVVDYLLSEGYNVNPSVMRYGNECILVEW